MFCIARIFFAVLYNTNRGAHASRREFRNMFNIAGKSLKAASRKASRKSLTAYLTAYSFISCRKYA
jgi:hypothetical protein